MKKPFVLLLESEVYGEEAFSYSTWQELIAGLEELFGEAKRCYKEDRVERRLVVPVPNRMPEHEEVSREEMELVCKAMGWEGPKTA